MNSIIDKINVEAPIQGVNLEFPIQLDGFSTGTPRIGIFIFPNNKDKGRLEDLFLSCVARRSGMKCVRSFMDCVSKLNNGPKNPSKAKSLAYLATQKETRHGIGGAARDGYWYWKSKKLDKVKRFLQDI